MGCSHSFGTGCRSLALLVLVEAASVEHEHCAAWASSGECEANPDFMWKTCESNCRGRSHRASDQAVRCQSWVKAGECQTNADFMLKTCPSSCGSEPSLEKAPTPEKDVAARPKAKANGSRNLKEEQQRQQEEIKRRAEELRRQRQARPNKTAEVTEVEVPRQMSAKQETVVEPAPAVRKTAPAAAVQPTEPAAPAVQKTAPAVEPAAPAVQPAEVKHPAPPEEMKMAKDAEAEVLKPWQMPAPSDVDDETFRCMREKFEIARQLDDANAREQSVRERAEAASGRASASEQRHRDCLKDLSEANQERQRIKAQQSDGLSEHYEQRVQELREQLRKELSQETAKLQKECSKREFQLQELARVANKRADQAEAQLAGRATGEERLQAERRAAEHAQEAQAAEQARLKIEEAYRAEGTKAAARQQHLQERLAKAEARVKFLEGQLETKEVVKVVPEHREPMSEVQQDRQLAEALAEALCEREAEVLFEALHLVFRKTLVLLWAPLSILFGRPAPMALPPNLVKLLVWMDRPAESVLEGLAALGGGQPKEMCHATPHVPGSAVCALAWLVACASLAVYLLSLALRLASDGQRGSGSASGAMVLGTQRLADHLAALFLPVKRLLDAFSVPEDVQRIAERRAELGHSPAQGTASIGASGSEPEPEEIYRRPAALEALLAAEDAANSQEPRPSPRFGVPDGLHNSAGPVT